MNPLQSMRIVKADGFPTPEFLRACAHLFEADMKKQLMAVELAVAVQTYPAPPKTRTTIQAATVTNKTDVARHLTVTVTPASGVPVNLVYQRVIAAKTSEVLDELIGQTIEPGGVLSAFAEVDDALDLVVSGFEWALL